MAVNLASLVRRLKSPNDSKMATIVLTALLGLDAVFCLLIVAKIPYTEIDWTTYMQQVEGFLQGEWDYSNLGGSTGPLVYPAGFLYVYTGLYWLTGGGHILAAQLIFILLYLMTEGRGMMGIEGGCTVQAIVMSLYVGSRAMPPWSLLLLCLSKRLHSIFVLRMFNDGVAMLLSYIATFLLTRRSWRAALLSYSAAVSVKMNILLMAPAVLLILLKEARLREVVEGCAVGGLLQLLLGAPFLFQDWRAYMSRAFDFSRIFMYRWTVNFKFLGEDVFQAKSTAVSLLLIHLTLLLHFTQHKWCRTQGGIWPTIQAFWARSTTSKRSKEGSPMRVDTMLTILFTANFIGVSCARSLHYQFYSWYFHMLPFLLWQVEMHTIVRCGMLLLVEMIWNIYPSTSASSACLTACHVAILIALYHQPLPSRQNPAKLIPARLPARNRMP